MVHDALPLSDKGSVKGQGQKDMGPRPGTKAMARAREPGPGAKCRGPDRGPWAHVLLPLTLDRTLVGERSAS